MSYLQWNLQAGSERRFQSGHPWIFSNELSRSPKGALPGQLVELRDSRGAFLARGYGNPHSLIAFRALTRDPSMDISAPGFLVDRVLQCWERRKNLGLTPYSCRVVHGEADDLPGLIIDRYLSASGDQVWVAQVHTAGIDRMIGDPVQFAEQIQNRIRELEELRSFNFIFRNDVAVRKLEGISEQEPAAVLNSGSVDLQSVPLLVPGFHGKPIAMKADLLHGQKTGFFLDQVSNIHQLIRLLSSSKLSKRIRMVDLCTYVGHWSTQVAAALQEKGISSSITLVDASASALEFASFNAKQYAEEVHVLRGDVLKDLGQLPQGEFDVVICDPPAFIKNRKDLHPGEHAYLKLNEAAMRLAAPESWLVSCSCSQLLEEESLRRILAKASRRSGRRFQFFARGTQSPDHPVLAEFTESSYLKAWIGRSN